jgi:hypothetical protein
VAKVEITLDYDDAIEALIVLEAHRRNPPPQPWPRLERVITEFGRAVGIPIRPTHKPVLVK